MKGKILPRSKLGVAVAVAYLLLVFFFLTVMLFGKGGLHGSAAMAALFVIILTLPLSLGVIGITDSLKSGTPNDQLDYLFVAMLVVCGVINAGVIYLAVGFVVRALRALAKKLARKST